MEYLFSIVIPVYNAEQYLERCIDSIIGQDCGFEKIQLVLVNDGSKDSSGDICQKYADEYPENVCYYEQTNAGVSAARNKGVELACGEYTGFVDADDVLSKNACKVVYDYFMVARDYVDVAVIPVYNFGAQDRPHYLNQKFQDGTKTLDLRDAKWFDTCTRVSQAFFRTEVIKNYKFDDSLSLYEDTKFINDVLMNKKRLGIINAGKYFYRRYPGESDSVSLTVGAPASKAFYLDTPKKISLYFLNMTEPEAPSVHLQNIALAEMRWRNFYNNIPASEILNEEEYNEYKELNKQILSKISDEVIFECDLYNFWQKVYLINMKYGIDILEEAHYDENARLLWKDHVLYDLAEDLQINLTDMLITNNSLLLKGYLYGLVVDRIPLYAKTSNGKLECKVELDAITTTEFPLDNKVYKYQSFEVTVPLTKDKENIMFAVEVNGKEWPIEKLGVSKLGNEENVRPTEQMRDGYIIKRSNSDIEIDKKNLSNTFGYNTQKVKAGIKKGMKKVRNRLKSI